MLRFEVCTITFRLGVVSHDRQASFRFLCLQISERTYMRKDLFWFTGSENSNPSWWENSKVHDGGCSQKRLLTAQQRREWRTRLGNLQRTVSIVTYIYPPGLISWRFYRHLKQHPSSETRHSLLGDILKFPNFGSCDGLSQLSTKSSSKEGTTVEKLPLSD